jgi:hypothetical protein
VGAVFLHPTSPQPKQERLGVDESSSLNSASAGVRLEHPSDVKGSSTTGAPSAAASVSESAIALLRKLNPVAVTITRLTIQRPRPNRSRRTCVVMFLESMNRYAGPKVPTMLRNQALRFVSNDRAPARCAQRRSSSSTRTRGDFGRHAKPGSHPAQSEMVERRCLHPVSRRYRGRRPPRPISGNNSALASMGTRYAARPGDRGM